MKHKKDGFGLLEAIISIAIFVIIISGVFGAFIYGQETTTLSGVRTRAIMLAQEGLEAVQSMRHNGFSSITEGSHGLDITGNHWTFFDSSDTTDIFTRVVEITDIDSKRKQITARVSWAPETGRAGEVVLSTYMTNWSMAHWANPIVNGGAGGNLFGDADGLKIQFQDGYAYAVTADGSDADFYVIGVMNPSASILSGSTELKGDLQNLVVDGDYAYIAAAKNSRMFQVVDISDPDNPTKVAEIKPTGTKDPNGIYKFGDYIYMTRETSGQEAFLIYDVSDPTDPQEEGELDFSDSLEDVIVIGNYAYIATRINSQELVIIDISNTSNPSTVGSYDLPGNNDSTSIIGFNNTLILGRDNGEVFFFDITDPTTPIKYDNNLNVNNRINDMTLGNQNQYALIVTAEENDMSYFIIVDISTPANPNPTATMTFSEDLNGVTYDSLTDRIYIVGENEDEQDAFIVIEPN